MASDEGGDEVPVEVEVVEEKPRDDDDAFSACSA